MFTVLYFQTVAKVLEEIRHQRPPTVVLLNHVHAGRRLFSFSYLRPTMLVEATRLRGWPTGRPGGAGERHQVHEQVGHTVEVARIRHGLEVLRHPEPLADANGLYIVAGLFMHLAWSIRPIRSAVG